MQQTLQNERARREHSRWLPISMQTSSLCVAQRDKVGCNSQATANAILSAGLMGTRPLDTAGLLAGRSLWGEDVGVGLAEPCSLPPTSPAPTAFTKTPHEHMLALDHQCHTVPVQTPPNLSTSKHPDAANFQEFLKISHV